MRSISSLGLVLEASMACRRLPRKTLRLIVIARSAATKIPWGWIAAKS